MSNRRMFRYTVPVDDRSHELALAGDPVAVAAASDGVVEFWAEDHGEPKAIRDFRVFGTGHPLPDAAQWVGTCPRTESGLVWHLYEMEPPQ
jgi:hypothetical protein